MPHKILLFILLAFTGITGRSQGPSGDFVLFNVNIINVVDGSVRSDQALLISDGKIKSIGKFNDLKKNISTANQVNGQGKYLIPGLWDMHVHLEGADLIEDNKALLPVFLAYGITTVRDCASDLGLQVLKWREEIKRGELIGPNIYTAGRKLEGKNSIWKGDLEISNEQELNAMLDTLDRDKVDFVKITENTLQGDLFLKSVKAAHNRGYKVSGHVPIDLTIEELSDAGFTSVEHATYLLRLGGDEPRIQADLRAGKISKGQADSLYSATFDQTRAIAQYRKMGARGLFVCPTIIGGYQLAYLKETDHSKDAFLDYLTKAYVSNYQWRIGRMANETPAQLQQRKDRVALLKKQLPLMLQSGIQLIAGSDAAALNTYVYPAESLIKELEIFQEAGLTPLQILQSATIAGARYFNVLDKTSTIQKGKQADLVLLNENPLKDAKALRTVNMVIAKGKLYDHGMIEKMLADAKATKLKLDAQRNGVVNQ